MEYRLSKENLGNNLLYITLGALETCMSEIGIPLYVIGATARDITMKLMKEETPKRGTVDLDVAIAIEDWNTFVTVCAVLESNNFKRVGDTQKFYYKGYHGEMDFEVDVVPFGGVAIDEKIYWPPEENPVMSVKCFEDVMKKADTVIIEDKVTFGMAPLCGQFLIKLDTWNDRNDLTDKDAEDMVFMLKKYFDVMMYSQDITPPDAVKINDDNENIIIWGTQWIAYDISKLLTIEHLHFYNRLIAEELDKKEKSILVHHFMKHYGNCDGEDISIHYEICRKIWTEFGRVLEMEISEREMT